MSRFIGAIWLLAAMLLPVGVVAPEPQAPKPQVVHGHGRKVDPVKLKAAFDRIHAIHLPGLKALPQATAAQYDCRTLGIVPPIRDQSSCGSCWDFSGSGMVTSALIKAGQIPNSADECSEQYTLDCYSNGGCNGDDNTSVLAHAKATGLPLDSGYGVTYQGSAGQCRSSASTKLYTIKDWGFCTTNGNEQSVASVQDIKNAMVAYGPIGTGIAAGGDNFWNSGQGTGVGTSTDIDHDVIIVGWDDAHDNGDGSKGAWIMRNSWGASWGTGGYAWVKYGAYGIGTEAVWCVAISATPVPPVPPTPIPPWPTPGAPVITSPLVDTASIGATYSYQIMAGNTPTSFAANFLPTGLTCSATGLISGTPTTAGVYYVGLAVENPVGAGQATLVLTVSSTPVNPTTITLQLSDDQRTALIAQLGVNPMLHAAVDKLFPPLTSPAPSLPPVSYAARKLESKVSELEDKIKALEAKIESGFNRIMDIMGAPKADPKESPKKTSVLYREDSSEDGSKYSMATATSGGFAGVFVCDTADGHIWMFTNSTTSNGKWYDLGVPKESLKKVSFSNHGGCFDEVLNDCISEYRAVRVDRAADSGTDLGITPSVFGGDYWTAQR